MASLLEENQPAVLMPEVIAASESLIQEMIVFGLSHFAPDDPNVNAAYLRWLCLQNPNGTAQAVVVRDNGLLVGQAILVPVRLSAGGLGIVAYSVVAVLTHPAYRNRRLFSAIIDVAKEFVSGRGEWLLGHPNAAAIPGWTRKEMAFRAPLVPYISGLGFGIGCRVKIVSDEAALKKVWPDFLAQAATTDSSAVRVVRTLEYMSWRFLQRPDKKYRLGFCRTRSGELIGFFAATQWRHKLDLIVDCGKCHSNVGHKITVNYPAIVMMPQSMAPRPIAALRLPVRKTMPFFATTFSKDNLNFDDLTIAVSDF